LTKAYQVIECLNSRQGTANGVDGRSILLCSIEKRRIDSNYICSLGRGRRTSLFFSTAGLQLSWAKCSAAPIWLHFHCLCLQPGSPYALTQCLAKKKKPKCNPESIETWLLKGEISGLQIGYNFISFELVRLLILSVDLTLHTVKPFKK